MHADVHGDPVELRVVYRSTGSENLKRRPAYYSKLLCLASFLRAVQACGAEREIVFLNDGPIPPDRLKLMHAAGEVVALPPPGDVPIRQIINTGRGSSGMTGSYLAALVLVDERGWPDTDVAYLAEDDYLYQDHSLAALVAAVTAIPAACYFSLYAKVEPSNCETFYAGSEPWLTAVSTTSTFGARIDALRADRWIHRMAWFAGGWPDESACQAYQGTRPFSWTHVGDLLGVDPQPSRTRRDRLRTGILQTAMNAMAIRSRFRPHLLVRPLTPLATHLETPVMARGSEWEAVVRETRRWLTCQDRR